MGQIGEILKTARLNKGITIKEAEEETKIRVKYLEALESESFHEIPGMVYVKGFLNNYATFLGLDAQEMVQLFKLSVPQTQEDDIIMEPPKPILEPKKYKKRYRFKPKYFRYLLGFVAILILLLFNSFWHSNNTTVNKNQKNSPKVEENKDVTTNSQDANKNATDANKQKVEPKQNNTQQPAATQQQITGVHLILNADKGTSWIRVNVDGALAFEGNINQGETKNFDGKDKITIRLGNAGAVNINYNGKSIGYLGEIGKVVDKDFIPTNN